MCQLNPNLYDQKLQNSRFSHQIAQINSKLLTRFQACNLNFELKLFHKNLNWLKLKFRFSKSQKPEIESRKSTNLTQDLWQLMNCQKRTLRTIYKRYEQFNNTRQLSIWSKQMKTKSLKKESTFDKILLISKTWKRKIIIIWSKLISMSLKLPLLERKMRMGSD